MLLPEEVREPDWLSPLPVSLGVLLRAVSGEAVSFHKHMIIQGENSMESTRKLVEVTSELINMQKPVVRVGVWPCG